MGAGIEKAEVKWSIGCSRMSDSLWTHGLEPARLLCPWDSPGKNTGVRSHSLPQGIFSTQGLNLGLLHCGQILYCLSHWGSPGKGMLYTKNFQERNQRFLKVLGILESVAYKVLFSNREIWGPGKLRDLLQVLEGIKWWWSQSQKPHLPSSSLVCFPWYHNTPMKKISSFLLIFMAGETIQR